MSEDAKFQFIDVIGEAEFETIAEAYRFTLKLKKKSGVAQTDKSQSVQKVEKKAALDILFQALRESEIPENHIRYGGVSDQKEWRKKGYERYQFTTFIITHDDVNHILALQADLAQLDIGKHVLEYSGFHPIYPKENNEKIQAFARAMTNAKAIASAIAENTQHSVGKVIHARDAKAIVSRAGHDNWQTHAVAGSAAGSGPPEFQEHKRTELVKIHVRFGLDSK